MIIDYNIDSSPKYSLFHIKISGNVNQNTRKVGHKCPEKRQEKLKRHDMR